MSASVARIGHWLEGMASRWRGACLRIAVACAAGCVSGCGPNFIVPGVPQTAGYTAHPLHGDTAQRFVQTLDIPGQWWTLFHSRALNSLVAEAMRNNPDLQAAQAALRRAREDAQALRGGFFPQIGGNFTGTGGNVGDQASSPLASNAPAYTLLTPQVTVSYAPDVFGLRKREVESADAAAESERFRLEAAYLTLTSNVVVAAIEEASLRDQIAAIRKILGTAHDNLTILHRQRDLGQISDADVLLQEAALAQIEEKLPPLEKRLAQQRNLLTALAGRFPNHQIGEKFTIAALHLPRDLPVSLPSKLVAQRPDIKAAEADLHAASAAVGVAIAARLPLINLTASYGNGSESLATLFSPQTAMWAVTGSVSQSLFDGFSLYHKEKAAQAAFAEAKARYRGTVIAAFRNVADVLYALDADARTYKAAAAAETAARKSLDLARKQLNLGQVNSLALLNAQQTYLQSSLVKAQAQASRYADTAALFQALGGGWWNRSDVGPYAEATGPSSIEDYFAPSLTKAR